MDDQGYGDLGEYGGALPTPHIDSIAQGGARFTRGYVTAPSCVPSRCGLITGRYQGRFHCESSHGERLPPSEPTLAQRLVQRGYATAAIGKWHLGDTPGNGPNERGFDEFFGFLSGIHTYFPKGVSDDAPFYEFARKHGGPLYRNREQTTEAEYLTTAFGREASAFIRRHADGPFFLYLAFNAVHLPLQAPPSYIGSFSDIPDDRRRVYAAMTAALDDAIGAVLGSLAELGLEKNTLVFYLSDNGGHPAGNSADNGLLRGQKGELYEGGIRVPFALQWRDRLPAGQVWDHPVSSLDIAATVIAASGASHVGSPKLDGVNLLPYLHGGAGGLENRALYWRYDGQRALLKGSWKIIAPEEGAGFELYNLATDPAEQRNLAAAERERVDELETIFEKMDANVRGYRRVLQPGRDKLD